MEGELKIPEKKVPVVYRIKTGSEYGGQIIEPSWTKDGLLIPSTYFAGVESHPIIIKIPRDICKSMIKDLLDEIRKEESGQVYD